MLFWYINIYLLGSLGGFETHTLKARNFNTTHRVKQILMRKNHVWSQHFKSVFIKKIDHLTKKVIIQLRNDCLTSEGQNTRLIDILTLLFSLSFDFYILYYFIYQKINKNNIQKIIMLDSAKFCILLHVRELHMYISTAENIDRACMLNFIKVIMTRKYHNHTLQTNPRHHEEETKNNSHRTSGRQPK